MLLEVGLSVRSFVADLRYGFLNSKTNWYAAPSKLLNLATRHKEAPQWHRPKNCRTSSGMWGPFLRGPCLAEHAKHTWISLCCNIIFIDLTLRLTNFVKPVQSNSDMPMKATDWISFLYVESIYARRLVSLLGSGTVCIVPLFSVLGRNA